MCQYVSRIGYAVRQIHQITALLKAAKFKAPSSDCLSPAGEYNLRLGIMKVRTTAIRQPLELIDVALLCPTRCHSLLHARIDRRTATRTLQPQEISPDFVATHSETPAVVDGHPFIVEAGVSLGGRRAKEGLTVYRFANRIPLLFEGGGDVVTRTAMKRIKCDDRCDVVTHALCWSPPRFIRLTSMRCGPLVTGGARTKSTTRKTKLACLSAL